MHHIGLANLSGFFVPTQGSRPLGKTFTRQFGTFR